MASGAGKEKDQIIFILDRTILGIGKNLIHQLFEIVIFPVLFRMCFHLVIFIQRFNRFGARCFFSDMKRKSLHADRLFQKTETAVDRSFPRSENNSIDSCVSVGSRLRFVLTFASIFFLLIMLIF